MLLSDNLLHLLNETDGILDQCRCIYFDDLFSIETFHFINGHVDGQNHHVRRFNVLRLQLVFNSDIALCLTGNLMPS